MIGHTGCMSMLVVNRPQFSLSTSNDVGFLSFHSSTTVLLMLTVSISLCLELISVN